MSWTRTVPKDQAHDVMRELSIVIAVHMRGQQWEDRCGGPVPKVAPAAASQKCLAAYWASLLRAGTTEELFANLPVSSLRTGIPKGFSSTASSNRICLYPNFQTGSAAWHSLRKTRYKVSVRATTGTRGPRLEHRLESLSEYFQALPYYAGK